MRLLNIIKKLSTLVICYIIIIIVIIVALIIFAVFYKNKIIIAIQSELYEEKVLEHFQSIYISCIIQNIINSEILLKKAYKLRDSLKYIEADKSSLNYVDINFLAFALSTLILNI